MAEILDTAAHSLSDYTKKLEIALFYTNGDEERAKQMIAGNLRDMYVIKGRFSSTTSFGAFIAFFNYFYLTLNSVYPVISDSFSLKDIRTNIDWKTFEKDMAEFLTNNEHDDVLGRQFKSVFISSFNLQFAGDLKKMYNEKGEVEINRLFLQIMQDRMGFQSVNMVVDIEVISSLDMELSSITSQKIMEFKDHEQEKKDSEPEIEVDTGDDQDALKGKEVKLILRGSLILSPISGREIGLLVMGDRLKVKIADNHTKAIHVAKAFNAYDDDGMHPITGRIVSIRHRSDGGYTIFVIIAKGIYVKIEELEENIKVAIDTSYMDAGAKPDRMSKISIGIIIALAVALAGLITLLVVFVLK
ncbi:MAG: hypothetical protein A2176_01305 [Spirochaetes bacterium RBG_13_51_14]|nr:MAG: hypothetical protein A2176_01305 [Spirochaetes bacterium RBG_13_51_14]